MSLKLHGKLWAVREQAVRDPVSGMTLTFEVSPTGDCVLRVKGVGPFDNRDFTFTAQGDFAGSTPSVAAPVHPGWAKLP